jgi:predicted nucleic acid-binding protein
MKVFDTSALYFLIKYGNADKLKGSVTTPLSVYEYANILWKEINLAKRISAADGKAAMDFFDRVLSGMRIVEPDHSDALHLAAELNISFYDAAFIQVARRLKATIVSGDRRMLQKASAVVEVLSSEEFTA